MPPMILEKACHEGMRRVARIYPYVMWGPGPWDVAPARRVAGLWPDRRRLARAVARGTVHILWAGRAGITMEGPQHRRYWLEIEPKHYALLALNGKGIWQMQGEWSHVDV